MAVHSARSNGSLMTAASQTVHKLPSSIRRSRRFRISLLILFPLAGLGAYLFFAHGANNRLRRAIEQADALDPGWRIQDLEARRTSLDNGQDAALVLTRAVADLPRQ